MSNGTKGFLAGPGNMHGMEAIAAVRSGRSTVRALYEDASQRIGEWEPALGAVVDRLDFREGAHPGPLTGMMVGIKNHFSLEGVPNWTGLQRDPVNPPAAHTTATAAQRLIDAGATLVATTASPMIGAPGGLTPQTRNPRSSRLVSGGSSGGSAAAVGAGLVHTALGSDGGGSIRIPAACCGVVGLNTTRGLVPLTGFGGMTYTLSAAGPISTSVADARLTLDQLAGHDPDDPYSASAPQDLPTVDLERLRVGIPIEPLATNMDAEIEDAFRDLLKRLQSKGLVVTDVSMPLINAAMDVGPRTLGIAESSARLEDEFGSELQHLHAVRDRVGRAQDISSIQVVRAYHTVAAFRAQLREVYERVDVLLMPTFPCRVPEAEGSDKEAEIQVGKSTEQRTAALTRFVNPWNLAALPAGTLPIARDSANGPISVQVIGRPFADWAILDCMEMIEQEVGGPWPTGAM